MSGRGMRNYRTTTTQRRFPFRIPGRGARLLPPGTNLPRKATVR